MLVVEQWAELRRLHFVDGVSVRELARRTGLHRKTIRRALASADPPKYARPPAASKLDPFKPEVHRLLKAEPRMPAVRLRELLQPLGYAGGETILKEHVREVRPFFLPARTYQRTVYLPGELAQCDREPETCAHPPAPVVVLVHRFAGPQSIVRRCLGSLPRPPVTRPQRLVLCEALGGGDPSVMPR